MNAEEALEFVRAAIPGVNFDNLFFDEVHAARVGIDDGPADEPNPGTFALNIELQRVSDNSIAFRMRMEVVRPDIRFDLAAVTQMTSRVELPDDEEVTRVLASRVAVPFVFPYLRSKVHTLALDMNVAPVMIGLIDPSSARIIPEAEQETPSDEGVG